MKKFTYFCIASVFLLLFISVISCADLYDSFEVNTIIYVSERGSANGDGTENSPFNTLQLAINKINASTDTSATWTILIDGTISGKATINSLNAAKLVIKKHNDSSEAKISGNNSADSGPLLQVTASAIIEIENVNFYGSQASGNGGGIYINDANAMVTLNSCTVTWCTASNGGGIYIGEGDLTLTNCTISSNTATSGGGIYKTPSGTVNSSGTYIINNNPNNTNY